MKESVLENREDVIILILIVVFIFVFLVFIMNMCYIYKLEGK